MSFKVLTSLLFLVCSASTFGQVFSEKSGTLNMNHMHVDEHVVGGGTAWFDMNNDGYEDIYVTGGDERDKLYLNNKNGSFTEIGISAGLGLTDSVKTVGVVTGDIDNDGLREIFVTTDEHHQNLLFVNNGNNTFTETSLSSGIKDTAWSTSAVFGDYNLDGNLDIYVTNYVDYNDTIPLPYYSAVLKGQPNYFYKNNGNGTFTEIATNLKLNDDGAGLVVIFTDYDLDNDLDIYVGNDIGVWTTKNIMYRNEYPADSFTDVSTSTGLDFAISNMGMAVLDYDEDQFLDFYLTDFVWNVLAKNNGNQTYTDKALNQSVQLQNRVCWGTMFIDYNNDSYQDLFIATGGITGIHSMQYQLDQVFKNKKGNFSIASLNAGVFNLSRARGATKCDFDLDGDQDLLVVGTNHDSLYLQNIRFYENTSTNDSNWIDVKVQGVTNNRDGYGTKIHAVSNGRKWVQEFDGGSSYLSQNSSTAHFGLGKINKVDTVVLTWPGGVKQTITDLEVNNRYTFLEGAIYTQKLDSICSNDSILISNQYENKAGLYYDSLSTSSGVDSIVMVHLSVKEILANSDSITICPSDSVLFDGNYINQIGVYSDTLISLFSCDSIHSLHLFHFPSYNDFTDTTTLYQDSVLVNGKYYSQAGIYVDTFYTNYGCDSLFTVKVTVDSSNISIQDFKLLKQSVRMYPNPTEGDLHVEVESIVEISDVVISDVFGKKVLNFQAPQRGSFVLVTSQLDAGVYIVEIHTNIGLYKSTIIVSD